MMNKYSTVIRPILYGSLALFNAVVYLGEIEKLYLGGSAYNNLMFACIFLVLLGIHFWMSKRLKKLAERKD
jgi:hypothetical protein